MLSLKVKHFFTSFLNFFFLTNFIVGTLAYIFIPGQMTPVPQPEHMAIIGVVTAVVSGLSFLPPER